VKKSGTGTRAQGLEEDKKELYPSYEYVAGILRESGLKEDFTASGSIRYIHRSLPEREIYFISNRTDRKVKDTCFFRDGTLAAELWDAVTGEIRTIDNLRLTDQGIALAIEMDAYQSYFVVFDVVKEKGERRKGKESTGLPEFEPVMSLKGPWKVNFDATWGGPRMIVFDTLSDWTTRPEPGIRFYSGIARYLTTFDFQGRFSDLRNSEFYLDLGRVNNLARVTLNGKDLGIIWTAPWRLRITDALQKKDNRLEIEVANLWINRLIGDEAEPWDGIDQGRWPDWLLNGAPRPTGRYTFTSYRYYKAGDPLSPSGLIGPVQIEGKRHKAQGISK